MPFVKVDCKAELIKENGQEKYNEHQAYLKAIEKYRKMSKRRKVQIRKAFYTGNTFSF